MYSSNGLLSFFFITSFGAKRSNQEKAKKTMLLRTSRPHPRRFFRPTHKEDLERMRSDEEADTFLHLDNEDDIEGGDKKE
jgi:hypothetical protein